MYHKFKERADVDITAEPMEVGPTCHYQMGGVRVEADSTATTVPGLYAAGEVAAGLHGANRLGGNSLSDIIVFGRRAGVAAAEYAQAAKHGVVAEAQIAEETEVLIGPLERKGGESPYKVHQELQE